MGDDLAIVNAARTSYLGASKGPDEDKKLLQYLWRHRHDGPFEMAEVKFRLRAPLVTFWQLVRHRTGSFNLQSGRYTVFDENSYYLPETLRLQSKSNKQGSDGILEPDVADPLLLEMEDHYRASWGLYKRLIGQGVAKEQARLVLPGFAVYYIGVWKIDLRNFLGFLSLRLAKEAQEEIRLYAEAMARLVEPHFPWTFEAYANIGRHP